MRGALFTTAELLHTVGSPAWEPVAATALHLPAVGLMGGSVDSLVTLPTPQTAPLDAAAHAFATARRGDPGGAAPEAARATEPRPAVVARFVDRGGFWEVAYAGRTVHAKASKGLADIARLLAAPDRDVHCLELAGAGGGGGLTGAVLDAEARRAYEQRIRDLQEDVDAAEADNDLARAERAQVELDAVVEHLAAALGLGGRSRRGAGTAERARSAVTQRVRTTIRRLGDEHPELGRHLEASITHRHLLLVPAGAAGDLGDRGDLSVLTS